MPEKPFGVATYAAGASLAAIALVYVFAPTYFLDGNAPSSGGILSSKKTGVVGLVNPANDCFINAVLQALAGLGDLRLYLIRETHRRNIDEKWVYAEAVPDDAQDGDSDAKVTSQLRTAVPVWKVEGLQAGIATKGLKDMLDQLNERPIYKKTVSAIPFVKVLEAAFRQRISRTQQDAQEFLQVVAERICDEYHAGRKARRYARGKSGEGVGKGLALPLNEKLVDQKLARISSAENGTEAPPAEDARQLPVSQASDDDEEESFPMEGKFESQVECLTCHFKPKPAQQSFCTLTLSVPTSSSTTLNSCFDGMFKIEFIDDFKCEKCRLLHARKMLEMDLAKSPSETFKAKTVAAIGKLTHAIETDSENPPNDLDLDLPDIRYAPTTRISRHTRITRFPKILAIHLSRSIYDASNHSQKNTSKVSFPERLPLGGLLQQRQYKLLATVTHKGSHQSGHYESFRRQNIQAPFSNPSTFQQSPLYSRSGSPATTPRMNPKLQAGSTEGSPLGSSPDLLSPMQQANCSSPSLASSLPSRTASLRGEATSSQTKRTPPTSAPRDPPKKDSESSSLRSFARSTLSKIGPASRPGSRSGTPVSNGASAIGENGQPVPPAEPRLKPRPTKERRKKLPAAGKWWRISDEKVKEASTREVLGMQREVYLLFYELERDA